MKTFQASIFGATTLAIAVGAQAQDYRSQAIRVMKSDFHAKGIAGKDRLDEDTLQTICNRSGNNPPKDLAVSLQQDQFKSIKYPADGKFLGDWKSGEKIAQRGRGMAWKYKAGKASRGELNGGSCYNCTRSGWTPLPSAASAIAYSTSARSAATARISGSTPTARSTTPRRATCVRPCRASAIRTRSPKSRSRTWLHCCWIRNRR